MNKITSIYKIHSKIKPYRFYIGSSINVKKRWNHHLNDLRNGVHHSVKLQRHYNKYGESDLLFTIVLGCDRNNILETEQYFLDSYMPYFNTCQIAGTCTLLKRSKESIEKQRKSMTGKKWTLEQRNRFSQLVKGRPKSEETKRKISQTLTGRKGTPCSEERKCKLSEERKGKNNPMFGRVVSQETREKLSKAGMGRKMSEKTVLRLLEYNKNRPPISDETREKMSLSATGKKRQRTPEHQRKLSESRKRNNLLRRLA